MVNNRAATLDATFHALADPTRRAMVARIAETPEIPVSELARPFRISPPAVSRHLRVLEDAGLLVRRRQGRVHHLRLVPAPLAGAEAWLDRYRRFWTEKLDALERYLREERRHAPRRTGPRRARAGRATKRRTR